MNEMYVVSINGLSPAYNPDGEQEYSVLKRGEVRHSHYKWII